MDLLRRYSTIRENRIKNEERMMRLVMEDLGITHQSEAKSRRIATMFSFFIPGSGQIYRGHIALGFIWLVIAVLFYRTDIMLGLAAHICCVLQANSIQVDKDVADYVRQQTG